MGTATADRMALVARLSAACSREIAQQDPAAAIPWPTIPTVAAMAVHLGGVHRWVTEVVRSRRAAVEQDGRDPDPDSLRTWFEEGRLALLQTLETVPGSASCWVIGDRTGTVADWQRRMVYEHVKHLIDLRASGGRRLAVAPELTPDDYADGIDELFGVFLPRSRSALPRLPGTVVLRAAESTRSWRIDPDWTIGADTAPAGRAVDVTARSGELALMLWERGDLLDPGAGAVVHGDRETLAALQSTSVHPW